MKITVLIENTLALPENPASRHLTAEHGLSFFIEYRDKKILLDAGSSDAFLQNASLLRVPLEKTDICLLSHGHYDHSTGFAALYDRICQPPLYGAELAAGEYYSGSGENIHYIGLPQNAIHVWLKYGKTIKNVTKISDGIWAVPHSTDNLEQIGKQKQLYKKVGDDYQPDDFAHEISYVFETKEGLTVFNSCSHGGAVNILDEVGRNFPNQKVKAFLGGLHMKGKQNGCEICTFSERDVQGLCQKLIEKDIDHVYTGHCTGSAGYEMMKKYLGDRIVTIYTGMKIQIVE